MLSLLVSSFYCAPLHPKKMVVAAFLFVSLSLFIVGMNLLCKAGKLVGKIPQWRVELLANGGYALSLLLPFAFFVWMLWRLIACYGFPPHP